MRAVEKNAFSGLDKLKVLDLSNNILKPKSFVKGFKDNDNLSNLEELYLSNISVNVGMFSIGLEFLDAMQNKPLKVLDLSRATVNFELSLYTTKYFTMDLFNAFPYIEKLNLSRSDRAMKILLYSARHFDFPFPGFSNLKAIDISYPTLRYQITTEADDLAVETRSINLTDSLKEMYFRKGFTIPLKIYDSNRTSRFKDSLFCGKLISKGLRTVKCCFLGAFNIEKVVFAENSIEYFDPNILRHMTSLRFLDLSINKLGDAFSQDEYVKATIANLNRLEVFIVSDNGIIMIPDDAFESCQNLKTLDLSNNKLAKVTFKTEYLVSLRNWT